MFTEQISTLGNSFGVQLETDISIITLDDNISHTYCSKIKWDKDNYSPLGTAQLIMPYSKEIEAYWIKYSGAVVIHANLNFRPQSLTQATMYKMEDILSLNMKNYQKNQQQEEEVTKKKDKKTNKIHLQNDYYNYSFIGKTARFKQVGKTFIVYLEDLGWKFVQKVPKEFRDSYIAGQSLDDAFQAICEFMGVEFAYSIEDLSEYTFSADGYSIEKDGQVIENVPSILKEWKAEKEEEEEDTETQDENMGKSINQEGFESSGLQEYKNKQKQSNNQSSNQSNSALNAQATNQEDNQENKVEEQQQTPDEKIEQYQEEFDRKIKDLFIGNTFYDSNISDPILNYDWITIVPKAPSATTDSTSNASGTTTTPGDTNSNNNNNTSSSSNSSSIDTNKNGWHNGQLYQHGKIVLYASYINTLSPQEAANKYGQGGVYTDLTRQLLYRRSKGSRV